MVVGNSLGSVTSSTAILTVDAAAAPAIATQPGAQVAFVGQTAQFAVAAAGSPTLVYQWQKNGAAISGATAPSLTTPVLTAADNGSIYTVTISNPVGSAASAAAALTVNAAVPPAVTTQPASLSVLAGQPATFSVVVSGSSPLTYQWQKNGANISGASASTFTIPAVQAADAASYTVIVANVAGSVTSAAATLALAPPGINLALGQPATASSSQDPVGLAASNAFDGNLTTRWASAQGVDPSWIEVDLGSVQAFNRVILNWEAAFARVYQILYSTDNSTWNVAFTNNNGVGGAEDFTFPTVHGRFVRMNGIQRATVFGYSLFEFQIYNVAECGNGNERYTVLNQSTVLDNRSQLTWQRAQTTFTAAGSQFTQPIAATSCSNLGMRLPTQAEALAISGASDAACAFPQPWNTWTSTPLPANNTFAFLVSSSGASTFAVADNFPGAVLCTEGAEVPPPSITAQPAAQTVASGKTATFSVAAGGSGPFAYQWFKNGIPAIAAAGATYTTPPASSSDNGALFSVVVTGPTGETAASNTATLTVTSGTPGGGSGPDIVAINAGGPGTGNFAADEDFSGGGPAGTANAISTSGVANAAPPAVYQTERAGVFTYAIPGLTAGTSYGVRLHFAEFFWTAIGQRVFNVSINGAAALTNFDVIAAAGGPNIALVKSFTATANASGQIVIGFTAGSADQPKVSAIEILNISNAPPASGPDIAAISAGGPGTGSFAADEDFSGGGPAGTANAISTSGVANAAPQAVYQTERAGVFTYTIPGLTAGTSYGVRLHFAEFYWTTIGQRVFNVSINGAAVLTNFDVIAAAGGPDIALVKSFTATANASGQIVIGFTAGSADQPKVSAIEIVGGAN